MSSNTTGMNEDNIQSMSVAIQLGKPTKMDYIFKDFNRMEWLGFKAWLLLRKHPKWADLSTVSETSNAISKAGEDKDDEIEESAPNNNQNRNEKNEDGESGSKNSCSYPVDVKQAKEIKKEEFEHKQSVKWQNLQKESKTALKNAALLQFFQDLKNRTSMSWRSFSSTYKHSILFECWSDSEPKKQEIKICRSEKFKVRYSHPEKRQQAQ